jgi:hypothetical protein
VAIPLVKKASSERNRERIGGFLQNRQRLLLTALNNFRLKPLLADFLQ